MSLHKTIPALCVLVALLVIVVPVSADPPGKNQDPFGGFPITGIVHDGEGAVARFGLTPWGGALPGGNPSTQSGNGSSPRKAIYIGGEGQDPETGERSSDFPNCGTVRIPAGSTRWFKLDTAADSLVKIWLDDELDDEEEPSGQATFGAAYQYMLGTTPGSAWQVNVFKDGVRSNFLHGFVMAILGPGNLKPNNTFNPPNAAILTLDVDKAGILKRGQDNRSLAEITGAGISSYGDFNRNEPSHLLWYQGHFDGWVYVMVYNQMIWDGTASVCSILSEILPPEESEGEESE